MSLITVKVQDRFTDEDLKLRNSDSFESRISDSWKLTAMNEVTFNSLVL